ncbi:hypothetical protein A1OQ_16240 [Enterovibrio norvegicus FF-162]|uniref:hypothetical protein n=1 Tax=Enterovibrio norvegicus TaxID=188144 RepID=UPI00035FC1F0|nr:hypothetical protein [Enterovibrio norvegicus]OEE86956.1 hypothetical protein A1OQ_16240 [Enterovibrio norvegicus FF-162]
MFADRHSKDIEKLVVALKKSDFVLTTVNGNAVSDTNVLEVLNTPKYYGKTNAKTVIRFLKLVYGGDYKNYLHDGKGHEHCYQLLQYMQKKGFVESRRISDKSFSKDGMRTTIHMFEKFYLTASGLEIYYKTKTLRNSKIAVIVSSLSLAISLFAFSGLAWNISINEERLDFQRQVECLKNPNLTGCENLSPSPQ